MICDRIANGVPQTTAAVATGVPKRTFQEWLEKGRREGAAEPYKSMADRIEAALAVYHESRIELVQIGAEKDPRLAFQELERRFRDDWADPRMLPAGGVNINVTIEAERRDTAERMVAAATRVLGDQPELLERFFAEFSGTGVVVDGEAVEVGELAA